MPFAHTGMLNVPRYEHTATLLDDGRVLIVGGYDQRPRSLPLPAIAEGVRSVGIACSVAVEQEGIGGASNTAELYEPLTGQWIPIASMETGRIYHTATRLVDGRVLVAGGSRENSCNAFASTELFDPGSQTWREAAPMGNPRAYHGATLLEDGRVLVTGGTTSPLVYDSAELYDPTTDSWQLAGKPLSARWRHLAVRLPSGDVLLIGGQSRGRGKMLDSTEVYDPRRNRFRRTDKIAARTCFLDAALLKNGLVLLIHHGHAALFDGTTGTWSKVSPAEGVFHTTLTSLPDGRAVGIGPGRQEEGLGAIVFDPLNGGWIIDETGLPVRLRHTATALRDGRILVVGGYPISNGITALLWHR